LVSPIDSPASGGRNRGEEMNTKKLSIAVVALAAGVLSMSALAQRAAVTGGNSQSHGDFNAATKVSMRGMNSAQQMLHGYIVGLQSHLLSETSNADARQQIILATNYYILASLTAKQQADHKTNVLQIEKYKPGGDWHKVLAAPTLISELLRVSPEQERQLAAVMAKGDSATGDVISAPGFMELSKGDRSAKFAAVRRQSAAAFRAALTPAQKKEWDGFCAFVDRDLKMAATGAHVVAGK
jgi:hypothetical protein